MKDKFKLIISDGFKHYNNFNNLLEFRKRIFVHLNGS